MGDIAALPAKFRATRASLKVPDARVQLAEEAGCRLPWCLGLGTAPWYVYKVP